MFLNAQNIVDAQRTLYNKRVNNSDRLLERLLTFFLCNGSINIIEVQISNSLHLLTIIPVQIVFDFNNVAITLWFRKAQKQWYNKLRQNDKKIFKTPVIIATIYIDF